MRVWSRVSGTLPGGSEEVAARLALDAARSGHRVRLSIPPASGLDAWAEDLVGRGLEVVREAEVISKLDWAGMARAGRQMADFEPDVVHLHLNHATADRYLPLLAPRNSTCVTTEHVRHEVDRFAQIRLKRWATGRVARVVAVSDSVRKSLVEHYGIPASKVQVIRNGVDLERFHPGDRARARTRLGLPSVGFVVGSAGRLTRQKGFDVLLRACARMEGAWALAIAGEGEDGPDLRALAAELEIEDRVRWLGRLESLEEFYPALDAFALASRWEGLPLTLLEALACGIPVAASAVDGILEVLSEGGGVMVPAESPEGLSAILGVWRGHETLRRQVAADAARVGKLHDWNRAAESYAALYEEVTAWKRSSSRQWW